MASRLSTRDTLKVHARLSWIKFTECHIRLVSARLWTGKPANVTCAACLREMRRGVRERRAA